MIAITCNVLVLAVLVAIIGMASGSALVPLDQLDQDLREEEEDASPALSDPAAAAPATDSIPEETTTTPMTWVTDAPPPVGRWRPAALEIVGAALGLGLLVCLVCHVIQLVAAKCRSGVQSVDVADIDVEANPPSASANIAAAADPSPTDSNSEQQPAPPQTHSRRRRAGCGPAVYYDCRLEDVHVDMD